MSNELTQLLARIRSGDEGAARLLVERYEFAIRIAIRTRLSDPRLRRQFDSLDVCQSVLASFFLQMASGRYDLHAPAQVYGLLMKMATNKLGVRARNIFRKRRDARRLSPQDVDEVDVVSIVPSPSQTAEDKDLLNHALKMMTPEIRDIAQRRMQGELWPRIAIALGGTPEARRKQFERAMQPIATALNISFRGG